MLHASVLQAASFSFTRPARPGHVGLQALVSLSLYRRRRVTASFGLANRSKLVNLRLGSFDRFSCLLRHRSRHHSWRRRRTGSAGSSRSPARPRRGRACSARSARGSAPWAAAALQRGRGRGPGPGRGVGGSMSSRTSSAGSNGPTTASGRASTKPRGLPLMSRSWRAALRDVLPVHEAARESRLPGSLPGTARRNTAATRLRVGRMSPGLLVDVGNTPTRERHP